MHHARTSDEMKNGLEIELVRLNMKMFSFAKKGNFFIIN